MKPKPITPYQRLKDTLREYADKVEAPHTKRMWRYPKEKLGSNWNLTDLAERVSAADQLGYDVILRNEDDGLNVYYRKKAPARPWEARYD